VSASFFVVLLPSSASTAEKNLNQESDLSGWMPFSQEILENSLREGRSVFVDGTAAWCATCQINELAVLDRPDVRTLLDGLRIVRLRADYTRPSAAIRSWLASVNRAGLPVYVLYRPNRPPYLFPELLTDGNFTKLIPSLVETR